MALEFGFRRRSGNTPATQASRLLQLQAYYAYEDYFEHTLRDASVLTIRVPKVQPRAAVLDTGATRSASNNPAEIRDSSIYCAVETSCGPASVGRLFEAGYKLDFRLPDDAFKDNVYLDRFLRYGGTI